MLREVMKNTKIVPVVVINDASKAVAMANALKSGGINIAEITFRTKAASDAIREIKTNIDDMLVGAGTILNVEMAKTAVEAGAQFIVSPGIDEAILKWCYENDIIYIPGITSPSEIQRALPWKLDMLKFFPAELSGGTKMLDVMGSVYKDIIFMPTGGINQNNIKDYLKLSNVIACGGSWICTEQMIDEGKFEEITTLCKEVLKMIN